MNIKFMSTITGTPVWSQGFELSSFRKVVNTAMHLYGPPVPRGNILSLISDASHVRLFHCMKFTCQSGTITKLMFIADSEVVGGSETGNSMTSQLDLLIFSIWRKTCEWDDLFSHSQCPFWNEVQTVSLSQYPRSYRPANSSNAMRVYEIELRIPFQQGDILGMRHNGDVTQQRTLRYQNGGGYCDAVVYEYYTTLTQDSHLALYTHSSMESSRDSVVPYIAIETGKICINLYNVIIIYYYFMVRISGWFQ